MKFRVTKTKTERATWPLGLVYVSWFGALAGHEPTADKYFSVLHIFIST